MGAPRVFGHKKRWPAQFVGERMGGGYVGMEEIRFVGTTGMIGTNFGIGSINVSRVATGLYALKVPAGEPYWGIIPGLNCPSGVAYNASITEKNIGSGTCFLQITRQPQGTGLPTLLNEFHNPMSGVVANLLVMVGATSAY